MAMTILILVVEDEVLIQQMVEDALVDGRYSVEIANTGEEAMAKLHANNSEFRVLITDVNLTPDKLTGWDIAKHAREINSEIPVVYMTGASGGDWSSKGVPKSLLLAKPFAPAQIVTAVSQLLNASTPTRD